MKRLLAMTLTFFAIVPVPALAQSAGVATATVEGKNLRGAGGEVDLRAKVVELDMSRRTATLRGLNGESVTIDVPADVKNFDQVRVGDDLVIRYATAVAVSLEPATKSGIRERVDANTSASAAKGALPGSGGARMVEVLAVVQSVNRRAGTVTLRGVRRTFTVTVPPSVDVTKIKAGDEVRAVFVEAAALSVERAPAMK